MAQSVLLSKEDGYSIYRMSFEIMEGLTMTGLFFQLDTREKRPLVIVQHGGQGTPELICGMYGSTTNYRDMLHRVLRQGVHVFAPQLLLWGESYEVPYDRAEVDAQLKRLGSSITAVEVYGIMRILDYFQTKDYVKNFGMVGLSYGGFYTLTAAALDPRIESAISCAFFNSRDKVGWTDWTWRNAAYHFDDAEITCLVYPRQLTIAIAREDELFSWQTGEASYHRLEQLCDHVGIDWVDFKLFSGKHEFFSDDEPIKKLVKILEG
jgi:dienelactone hydrolase